ncbi:serine hydrolase [bacterium]|nr:serine hydrolase [bacterium]
MKKSLLLAALCLLPLLHAARSAEPATRPSFARAGMDRKSLAWIDKVVAKTIEEKTIPGAVILVSRREQVVYRKAFGYAELVPEKIPMTVDRMFDLASVTKPVATATSIMVLCERGQLRLTDRVSNYLPEFTRFQNPDSSWADEARIWHLLTHTSGLPAYTNADTAALILGQPCTRPALAHYLAGLKKMNAPGEVYRYSCLGFITLAYVIEKITGKNVHEFSREAVFQPLRMHHTTYVPGPDLLSLCVPTEVVNGQPWRGIVHDPLARLQGGISGNAGLFSTVDDLARYCQMMLNGGVLNRVRILSPVTVKRMIHIPETPSQAKRGYGWVVKDGVSWVGGDLLPDLGYGHTGYTGTSIWIDPATQSFIIILTNRVHPQDRGEVDSLRSAIANIVAGAMTDL